VERLVVQRVAEHHAVVLRERRLGRRRDQKETERAPAQRPAGTSILDADRAHRSHGQARMTLINARAVQIDPPARCAGPADPEGIDRSEAYCTVRATSASSGT